VRRILALTRRLDLPIALATSTRADTARRKLALAGFVDYFDFVIGGDDVIHAKPNPEPYVTAAARLGMAPSSCWALEDSDNGVRAAPGAGAWVIQIPDLVPPSAEVRARGTTLSVLCMRPGTPGRGRSEGALTRPPLRSENNARHDRVALRIMPVAFRCRFPSFR
jgi:beta-phosphoglucomutase-like phosphatase (HAD superfamily)